SLGICCPNLELLYKLYGHSEEDSREVVVPEGSKISVKDANPEKNKTVEMNKDSKKNETSENKNHTKEPKTPVVIEEVVERDEIEPVAEEVKKARLYVF